MAGSYEGGKSAARTNKKKYGADYYARIGAMGGKAGRTGGFAAMTIGKDGLTGPERASVAGMKGGTKTQELRHKVK